MSRRFLEDMRKAGNLSVGLFGEMSCFMSLHR